MIRSTADHPLFNQKLEADMPRPPAAKPDEPTKTFVVCKHRIIFDNDGVRKVGGDTIELTFPQAKFHKAKGTIEVPLEEFEDDTPATTVPQASAGGQADGSGEPAVGSTLAALAAQTTGKNNS
ncbi:MAG: hypothetical protein GKR86_00045 [Ilumatobacter sp.]|nr:hypothetical protein [Ilumatobacter sp.]